MYRQLSLVLVMLCCMSIAVSQQLYRHHDHHQFLYQWTGDQCDDACHHQQGQACGRILKECCTYRCEGTFWKSCYKGETIKNLDCTYQEKPSFGDSIKKKIFGAFW